MATKRLAMSLGLVQKRSANKQASSNVLKAKQEFEYLVVLDFESTCWAGGPRVGNQEIIEFPAVLLCLGSGEVLAEFQQYVMPVEQPYLSEFCKNLTGITQEQVDAGMPLGACLCMFSSWIRELCEKYQFSFNGSIPGKHATFATWSDWDLGVCLHYECQRKNLRKPAFFNQWTDVRLLYTKFYQRRPKGLNGALQDLGITFEGREHSGICDTRNTAVLISRMVRDGCVITVTKTLATNTKESAVKAVAHKILNQVKAVVTGKRKVQPALEGSSLKFAKLQIKTFNHNVNQTCQSSAAVFSDEAKQTHENERTNNVRNSSVLETSSINAKDNPNMRRLSDETISLNYVTFDLGVDHVITDESAVAADTVTDVSPKPNECCMPSLSRTLGCGLGGSKMGSDHPEKSFADSSYRLPSLGLHKQRVDFQNRPKSSSVNVSSEPELLSLRKVNSCGTLKTPVSSSVQSLGKNCDDFPIFKKTPPLCECGRRAKLLMASKPGPNQGRYFHTCPVWKTSDKIKCTYFKWEDQPYVKSFVSSSKIYTPVSNLKNQFAPKSVLYQRSKPHLPKSRQAVSEPLNRIRNCGNGKTIDSAEKDATAVDTPARLHLHYQTNHLKAERYQITPFIVRNK